jgi:hypothetical protein
LRIVDNRHRILRFAEINMETEKDTDDGKDILLVEYVVHEMGTSEDLAKRHELQNRLEELLSRTGLGDCDGGSIGNGTMEVCCYVVDFVIAKKVIEEDLRGTEFENYSRIYQEK